ncbi:MAG: alkylhydroperoxidase [Puniceicoccaceae bacterium 5H]|nr:MAG: alkylhydroperoxidase [Puniceicoccaceae bacterium 5H]
MEPRLDYYPYAEAALKAQMNLEGYLRRSSLSHELLELVKLRVSQINGCAFCVHMHIGELRQDNVEPHKIDLVAAWHESPCFSERERAAFAWAEAVTRVADTRVPDDVYAEARRHFSEAELVDLTWNVCSINTWNRLSVSFRRMPQLD